MRACEQSKGCLCAVVVAQASVASARGTSIARRRHGLCKGVQEGREGRSSGGEEGQGQGAPAVRELPGRRATPALARCVERARGMFAEARELDLFRPASDVLRGHATATRCASPPRRAPCAVGLDFAPRETRLKADAIAHVETCQSAVSCLAFARVSRLQGRTAARFGTQGGVARFVHRFATSLSASIARTCRTLKSFYPQCMMMLARLAVRPPRAGSCARFAHGASRRAAARSGDPVTHASHASASYQPHVSTAHEPGSGAAAAPHQASAAGPGGWAVTAAASCTLRSPRRVRHMSPRRRPHGVHAHLRP